MNMATALEKIWADRIISGTQLYSAVPAVLKEGVTALLEEKQLAGEINTQTYDSIISK